MTLRGFKDQLLATATLFASCSTLLCCALPALLVALGAGSVMAGIVSTVPQLTWVSYHKVPVFIFAGMMLTISGIMRWRNRYAPCPLDPVLAGACLRMRKFGLVIFAVSLLAYGIGGFFAFIAPLLLR